MFSLTNKEKFVYLQSVSKKQVKTSFSLYEKTITLFFGIPFVCMY